MRSSICCVEFGIYTNSDRPISSPILWERKANGMFLLLLQCHCSQHLMFSQQSVLISSSPAPWHLMKNLPFEWRFSQTLLRVLCMQSLWEHCLCWGKEPRWGLQKCLQVAEGNEYSRGLFHMQIRKHIIIKVILPYKDFLTSSFYL